MNAHSLAIESLGYQEAMALVVERHYLHRKCPCSCAFALKFEGALVGVIVFGKPASYTLCNGIAGADESKNVIEFNRMWTQDVLPPNAGSWFVSRALKLCGFDIVVSFADTEQGHTGYIYQATNWLYCGVSKKQKYFRVKQSSRNTGGINYRRRERMAKHKIISLYGEEYVEEYYSSLKHRYIFFNGDKRRKNELRGKLRYAVQPYPKNTLKGTI